ncbi:HRDC domain-containing protein [Corynebacterium mayonis]|uniref:HRDC domain-containing protein n=1 Tax=Corynebacterium mayonis TaxID=3062461 RepID=UPI0031408744
MQVHSGFELIDDPRGFERAAESLSRGLGPFAIDTERASTFRYDDRAFLVQVHRRYAGTYLLAPEGHRDAFRRILGPVIGGEDWILHAAGEDLASLAELELQPASLFDTELAARLAGFDKPNLAAMVEHFVGVALKKGYGREDWSRSPLPLEWQRYAAEDVLYLHPLAEALSEYLDQRGKLDWATEEFAHAVATASPPEPKTWRDVKGIATLKKPSQLQVAQALWHERDRLARSLDTAPSSILPNKVLVDIARATPTSSTSIASVKGFPRHRRRAAVTWSAVVREALATDASAWPAQAADEPTTIPEKNAWKHQAPWEWEVLQSVREKVAERAVDVDVLAATLLSPALLREAVWAWAQGNLAPRTHEVAVFLAARGARPWQVAATAPVIASVLCCP